MYTQELLEPKTAPSSADGEKGGSLCFLHATLGHA